VKRSTSKWASIATRVWRVCGFIEGDSEAFEASLKQLAKEQDLRHVPLTTRAIAGKLASGYDVSTEAAVTVIIGATALSPPAAVSQRAISPTRKSRACSPTPPRFSTDFASR
jgi:hypothetical protein